MLYRRGAREYSIDRARWIQTWSSKLLCYVDRNYFGELNATPSNLTVGNEINHRDPPNNESNDEKSTCRGNKFQLQHDIYPISGFFRFPACNEWPLAIVACSHLRREIYYRILSLSRAFTGARLWPRADLERALPTSRCGNLTNAWNRRFSRGKYSCLYVKSN